MYRVKPLAVILSFFVLNSFVSAQNPVNAYAQVTAISGSTLLTVASVNETYHSFEDGDFVIIMQMQDNVIGANTTNVATFGDLSSIQSAGLFEVARILSHTESASLPNSITLYSPLVNAYNINPNASVQLITFRNLGANYTTSANIGTAVWNGTIGGVTAISVTSVLTVGHNISANFAGFTFGVKNSSNFYSTCDNATYATSLAPRYAGKGEGIYKNTNTAIAAGRGKMLNGGGGGNDVNSGGGGGGNYTTGGNGGGGWNGSGTGCNPTPGGLGGISLSGVISGSRIFMGGGGGGGHQNDNVGTVGAAGGGILIIRAGTLTTISCAGITISATGSTAVNAVNDGAGGGGAGGSILFNVGTFSVAGACQLTVSANGGNGGNSNAGGADTHGGAGGGGQGVVIYSGSQPTLNVTTSTKPGTGGSSCGPCPAGSNGQSGTGPPNAGIVTNVSSVLPVELESFDATVDDLRQVFLTWKTAVEKNAKGFSLQRMDESDNLIEIGFIPAKGSYNQYRFLDASPVDGLNYYRLKQIDLDGKEYLKNWIMVELDKTESRISVYPNPLAVGKELLFKYNGKPTAVTIWILSVDGNPITQTTYTTADNNAFKLNTSQLPAGVYVLKIKIANNYSYKKLVVTE